MNALHLPALSLTALLGLALVGCDAAEESAQKLTEKAGQVAQEVAREAVSDTVNALNDQIDKAQKSSKEFLGKPEAEAEAERDKSQQDAEQPSESIET